MQIILQKFGLASVENAIREKVRKCVLYCDFNVVNIIYEKNLKVPKDFILYPDSNLIHFVLNCFYRVKVNKIVSTDLLDQLLNFCNKNKLKIYLFGDRDEILVKIKDNLKIKFPNISVVGYMNGYKYDNLKVINDINNTKPDVLLIGLGAGRQEEWAIQNYNQLASLISISVGGYFRFLSGVKKRAPNLFRILNLEWFYRLVTEFNLVWKKYSINMLKFLFRVITKKIYFIYNSNER
jgi:N-acetylglucosaminyldiphosphoundecaprenol N-acetyl-beta-D-mannosaminyltransferase